MDSMTDMRNNDNLALLRDYRQDFSEENGQYMHQCRICKNVFIGHKRRPSICSLCKSSMDKAELKLEQRKLFASNCLIIILGLLAGWKLMELLIKACEVVYGR